MSGAPPGNPNKSSTSGSRSRSSSSSDNGNGDGNVCGKGGIECDSSIQLRLYRATMLATPLIFALVLLSLLCMFCIRRCRENPLLLRRRSTHRQQQQHQSIDMTRVPPQQYGLSKSFRDSLPVVHYKNGMSSSFQDSQCAVCLGDYLQDEKIKHLPACNHCFHAQCIDKWLSTNLTCPICRAALIRSEEIGNGTDQSNRNRIWEERVITQSQGHVDVVNDMSTISTPPSNVLISEVVVVGMDRS